jgi:imidazolonepropionase-like amidohydrolase
MTISDREQKETGIPLRVFLYTLDQISVMVEIPVATLEKSYIYFEGRTIATFRPEKMRARNISAREDIPEWRVADKEVIRWLKNRGFKVIERGWVQS